MSVPTFWKSTLSEIENIVANVKKGTITETRSAGNRPIYLVEYGKRNNLQRKANYSSACGAGNINCYANKDGADIRPTIFFVGGIHGAEVEGCVAILNLIHIAETGKDIGGVERKELSEWIKRVNLLLIPCLNPDGRARFPKESAIGMTTKEFRYYAQGTWTDGSLCNWPDCKKIHPILDAVDYLGAYYNDDGINLMHDNFFLPMSDETKFLLETADSMAPDITILLHGCAGACSELLMPRSVHDHFKDKAYEFSKELVTVCADHNMQIALSEPLYGSEEPIHAYNLVSAITHICGELCMVYECNQGLIDGDCRITYEEMYEQHLLLIELACKYAEQQLRL